MSERGSAQIRLNTGDYYVKWRHTQTTGSSNTKGAFTRIRAWKGGGQRLNIRLNNYDIEIRALSGMGGQEREIAVGIDLWTRNPEWGGIDFATFVRRTMGIR